MQVQNVSFKGYQNVVATNTRFINADVSLFSAKLNNKDYVNDLDKWKALQKKLFPNTEPKDILTFMHIKERDGEGFQLFLNDRILAPVKDVFLVSNEEEKPMMQSFILLRSITERIMSGKKSEWNFVEIVNEMLPHNINILKKAVAEPTAAADIMADAVLPSKEKTEAVASIFYNSTEDYMDNYVEYLEQISM